MNVQAKIAQEMASHEVAAARDEVRRARESEQHAIAHRQAVVNRAIRDLLDQGFHPDSFADAIGVDYAREIWPIQRQMSKETIRFDFPASDARAALVFHTRLMEAGYRSTVIGNTAKNVVKTNAPSEIATEMFHAAVAAVHADETA